MCRAPKEVNHLCHHTTRMPRPPAVMHYLQDLRRRTRQHSSVHCCNCLHLSRQVALWVVAARRFRSHRRRNCTAHRRSSPRHQGCATTGAR